MSSEIAVSPSRRAIFYGWWVVAVTAIGVMFGYSSFISTIFGLFVYPLEIEFGWTRTDTSIGGSLIWGSIVVLAPISGFLVDRFGARRVLLVSLAAFGLAICALATLTTALWHFYAMILLVAVAGMGTQPMVFSRVVVSWFDRHRGLSLAITLSGVGLAASVLPWILQPVIAEFGWRAGYLTSGIMILLVAWPLVYFFLINTPMEMGLYPDGTAPQVMDESRVESLELHGFDLRTAAGTRQFWQMLAAFLLLGLMTAGFITHFASLLRGAGFSMTQVSLLIAIEGAAMIAGRILCGILVDRFFAPYIAGAFTLLCAAGLALLAGSDLLVVVAIAGILIGLGTGAEFDLMGFLISRYSGLVAYGRIYGVMYSAFCAGGAVGPLAMGWSFDLMGSYSPVLWIFAGAPVVAAVLFSVLGPYRFGLRGEAAT